MEGQPPGNSGLTVFRQDDISAFVFPDDGRREGADHITHDHGIFPLPELLWGWCILEHELLWKTSKRRVRANSRFPLNDPFSLEPYCSGSSCRQLSVQIHGGPREGPAPSLAKMPDKAAGVSRGMRHRCWAVSVYSRSAEFIVLCVERVYGGKGVCQARIPGHVGRC